MNGRLHDTGWGRFFPLGLLFALFVCGCEPKGPYPLAYEQVMAREKKLPGEIVTIQGVKSGEFKEGAGAVGNENTSGDLKVRGQWGDAPGVKWPTTPGYYYEAHSYISESQDVLYVVRKLKAQTQ